MEFKKSMLILILAIFLVSIAGVCAADANDTAVASEDANQIEVSSNDVIVEDSLKTNEENATLAQTNDDETLSAESDSQILTAGEGTYYDLIDEIGDGGDKSLTKSYYSYTGGDTITITNSGVIDGNGAVIDMAGSNIQAFRVTASDVTIKNLIIKNANFNDKGGAIRVDGANAKISDCNFMNNTASVDGGAIYWCGSDGVVVDCSFVDNSAGSGGGAVYWTGFNGSIANSSIIDNFAGKFGGAILLWGSNATVSDCNFADNSVTGSGGAILVDGANANLSNCSFINNSATNGGGAIYWNGVNGNVYNCSFVDNSANSYGGVIYNSGTLTITDTKLNNNTAREGGAVYNMGTLTIANTNLTNNTAKIGGAIYNMGTLTITNTNFINNNARNGGAIYNYLRKSTFTTKIINNTFTDNSAQDNGGAIYNYLWRIEGTTTIKDNTFIGNTAEDGTAIYTDYKDVDLQSIDLENNNFNNNNYTFNTWAYGADITVVGNTLDDLQDSVDYAKDGQIISLEGIEYNGTTEIYVNKCLTFIGKENTTLRVLDVRNIFNIDQGAFNITFKNIKFAQGCINFVGHDLTIINCTIDGLNPNPFLNVDNIDSKVTVLNSSFTNNTGDVLCLVNANSFILDNCIFTNNLLHVSNRHVDSLMKCLNVVNIIINNSTFTNNSRRSGCIKIVNFINLNVTHCIFKNNTGIYSSAIHAEEDLNPEDNMTVNIEYCDFISSGLDSTYYFDIKSNFLIRIWFNSDIDVNIKNCKFENNSEGFIQVLATTLNITNCSLINNHPTRRDLFIMFSCSNLKIADCIFENNTDIFNEDDCIVRGNFSSFENCIFKNNLGNCIRLKSRANCNVFRNCIFENNLGYCTNMSGSAKFSIFENCSFKNNSGNGIGISTSNGLVSVLDCEFENNSGSGITIERSLNSSQVLNCSFKNNSNRGISIESAKNITIINCDLKSNHGGGINIDQSDSTLITNCSFTDNSAENGGAILIDSENGMILNCNFERNIANHNSGWTGDGGAIYVTGYYTIKNCSFINNSANDFGAISANVGNNCSIDNCSFINNSAASHCGALGTYDAVTNCIFLNNHADTWGAADVRGIVVNCSFINNSAVTDAGALNLHGEIINCSFINNSVTGDELVFGGALTIYGLKNTNNTVNYCKFINNSVRGSTTAGGAIFARSNAKSDPGFYLHILNSVFVNNSAISDDGCEGGAITVWVLGYLNSTIINCTFENNSDYGGYNGVYGGAAINFESSTARAKGYHHSIINSTFKSNKEYGVYFISVDNNFSITLNLEAYESLINAIYVTYPPSNPDLMTIDFYNVTYWDGDEEFNTDEVYPVASTLLKNQDIIMEIYDSQGNLIDNVTVRCNGKFVYDYTDLPMGVYTYFAYHPDNEYYGYANVSGSFEVGTPFDSLNEMISHGGNITLKRDYVFDSENCSAYIGGFVVDKNVTIYGNGHYIDANGLARIFNVTDGASLTLVNVTLKNGQAEDGGAIYAKDTVVIINSTLKDNHVKDSGGAIYSNGNLTIVNSLIDDNSAIWGAVYVVGTGSIVNSTFTNNNGLLGGAVYNFFANLTITGSNITDNYANFGAGVYNYCGNVVINSSTLKNNSGDSGSAIWTIYGAGVILNDVKLVDNAGEALTSDDGVAIDTTGVKFLTALSFKIEDINDTLKGCEITINITEQNKGKEFSGNVTVFIGDANYTVEIINGTGLRTVTPNWGLKTYTVRLTFNETDIYYSATAEGNPFHIRTNPTITIADIQGVDEGTQITVKVNAVDSFNRDLIVTIGGENYTVSMTNGSGERAITLAPGTYEATITFPESNCYTADNAKSNAFIVRANPRISIAEIANVIQGTPVTIKVTAVKSFNGELVIAINGENYTVSMTNGSGERTITLAPGTYNATISFPGNDYYTVSNAQSNGFTVSKESTSITANAVTVVYNTNKNLVITLKDSKGKPIRGAKITINLNGAKTYTTDKNGQVKVPTKGLAAKTYTAKITFNGNANYIKSAKNVKVTVKKATPKLTAKNKKFKKTKKTKKYTITLKDNTGKAMKKVKVTLKIKGKKTFKAKTNNKGKATFKIKKLTKKGKYKATVTYKGDKNYNKVTKKVKITIK